MVLSTRISIQWGNEKPQELTNTLALTTPDDHYVDIRVFKDADFSLPFHQVFELCLSGMEVPEGEDTVKFVNNINTQTLKKRIDSNDDSIPIPIDVGHFSPYNNDRKEVGEMEYNGEITPYTEIWRSLDPVLTTPDQEVRETTTNSTIPACTFQLINGIGKLIRLGNWVQGIYQQSNQVHIIRSWYDSNQWRNQIEYGDVHNFPISFQTKLDDVISINNLHWKCVEIDN